MVGSSEPDHLKGEGLPPKVGGSFEGDGQVNLPKGLSMIPWYDAVEQCRIGLELRPIDPHEV
jgi:hypothetical protein